MGRRILAALAVALMLAGCIDGEPVDAPSPATTEPTDEPTSEPTDGGEAGGDPSAPAGRVHYADCDAARSAGAAPIEAGDPGYRAALDRNRDGVACE